MSSQHPSGRQEDLAAYHHRLRHTAAHVMAAAVVELFPDAKLGIGPSIEDGFYYDFLLPRPLTPEDLEAIATGMKAQIAAKLPMQRRELSRSEAHTLFSGQPFKLEVLEGIAADTLISTYRHGSFEDLCEGPHVASTAEVKAFKLLSIAGAYWRGDEHRPMLQRIYATAFESQEALDDYVHIREEAERRDHRKLGKELDLFMMDPVAPASPFYLPKGTIVYNQLVEYVRGLYKLYGYQEVITPQIFDMDIWKRSGHYDHYKDNMYLVATDEEREFGLKPMNCPAHAIMFGSQVHSYREMPLRFADFGRLHRYERSGVVQGLTRVRTFVQDDAHIFCTPGQIDGEIHSLVKMFHDTYRLFNFDRTRIVLSLRPDSRIGSEEMWDRAEGILRDALAKEGLKYQEAPGEGAFYGPKVDFMVPDAIGREWQLGTIQLDFNLGQRFDLEYVAEDGSRQHPVVLHRAMLGSLDRFMGVLIEHYAGAFPVWLAPVQAVVIPIADRHTAYARQVEQRLKDEDIRVLVDDRSDRMNSKIRDAQMQKIPYMLVVGDREAESKAVAVRLRSGENPGAMPFEQAVAAINGAIASKT